MGFSRWQDWANLVLGSWMLASPWALNYSDAAAWNAYSLGAGIVLFASIAAYMPKSWEEMINTLLGIWLVVSPFALGFSDDRLVSLHTVLVGILATAFAVWAMASDQRLYKSTGAAVNRSNGIEDVAYDHRLPRPLPSNDPSTPLTISRPT